MDEKKDNRGTEHNSGRGYMLRLLSHIVIATVVTLILEVFLVTNVTSISGYLYQTGNDSLAVQRFAFGSTVSVLLFCLPRHPDLRGDPAASSAADSP